MELPELDNDDNIGERGKCLTCLENEACVSVVVCGHLCFCLLCAREVRRWGVKRCIVCKSAEEDRNTPLRYKYTHVN
jgi:Zinc finger, C3HC4 type (RING finger)